MAKTFLLVFFYRKNKGCALIWLKDRVTWDVYSSFLNKDTSSSINLSLQNEEKVQTGKEKLFTSNWSR